MTTLADYMGAAYAAQMMGRGSLAGITAALQAAMLLDPALQAAAQAQLAGLDDGICDRDIISKCQRDFLTAVLA